MAGQIYREPSYFYPDKGRLELYDFSLSSKFSSLLGELSTSLRGACSSLRCPPTELPCNLAASTMRSLLSFFETFASFLLRVCFIETDDLLLMTLLFSTSMTILFSFTFQIVFASALSNLHNTGNYYLLSSIHLILFVQF